MERISYQELPQGVFTGMLKTEEHLRKCGISTKELELMRYRASQINNCAYCLDMHFKEATHAGESPLRLYSVSAWRETPYYSEKEQAMLALTEALTLLPDGGVHEDLYEDLRKHFSKEEIANLTLAVAQINAWNRVATCFKFTPGNYQVGQH